MLRLQMKYIFKFCHINRVGQYFRFSLATRGQRRQWRRKERDVFLSLILVIASQPFPSSSYLNNVSDTRNTRLYTLYIHFIQRSKFYMKTWQLHSFCSVFNSKGRNKTNQGLMLYYNLKFDMWRRFPWRCLFVLFLLHLPCWSHSCPIS